MKKNFVHGRKFIFEVNRSENRQLIWGKNMRKTSLKCVYKTLFKFLSSWMTRNVLPTIKAKSVGSANFRSSNICEAENSTF